jgi:uncharacterized protein YjbJ (UPF0337 family)
MVDNRRTDMNTNIAKGTLKELQGKIKQSWGDITDDDLTKFNGKREELEGILQKKYGYTQEKARQEVNRFFSKI